MKHILVLDIESTGLDAQSTSLLELSAVRLSADFSEELAVFDSLVKPDTPIPPFIERLTNISDSMVTNAPELESVRADFLGFLQPTDIICGHNIQFDLGFLNAKGFQIANPSLDTFAFAHLLLPEEPSYSLEILTERYAIEHKDAHRALADVRANAELLKKMLAIAEHLPAELRRRYDRILAKSVWAGGEILRSALKLADLQPSADADGGQLELFGDRPVVVPAAFPREPAPQPTEREMAAGRQLATEMEANKSLLASLPLAFNELAVGAEAARALFAATGDSVAVALPDIQGKETPAGFYRFASSKDVICETAFEKWFARQKHLDEVETTVALKYERERYVGNSMIIADFPAIYTEKQVAREWLSHDHTRCKSDCPAKALRLGSFKQPLYFCKYEHLEDCPAETAILLKSDSLIHHIDAFSRERLFLDRLEKALAASAAIADAEIADAISFRLGLLKRWAREQVGPAVYSKNILLEAPQLEDHEIKNLAEGFFEDATAAAKAFPEQAVIREDLRKLGELLTEPLQENECRFLAIAADDSLTVVKAPKLLSEKLDALLAKKRRVSFVGSVFLRKHGKAVFGSGLDAPEKQLEIAPDFDFANQALFLIPEFGGNLKTSDASVTTFVAEQLLPVCDGNVLMLFPGNLLGERFCAGIAEAAEAHGFRVLTASGSSAKLKAQLQRGKILLVATANSIRKIDFCGIRFCACVQHRIFFDPPPDPAVAARNRGISDEFLDFSLPLAVQRFERILYGLACGGNRFAWVCLDAGFQKRGNYTAEFLDALPRSLTVRQASVKDLAAAASAFLTGESPRAH